MTPPAKAATLPIVPVTDLNDPNERTIFERIQQAQRDIAKTKFEKTQKVSIGAGGGYYIIPIADILQAVRKAQAEHGITLLIGKVQFDKEDYEVSAQGHAIGHVDYRLVGKNLEDSIEGTVTVEARDTSDKLVNKLVTNAMRTIYRTVYCIDAGEDPEAENSGNAPASQRIEARGASAGLIPAQQNRIKELVERHTVDVQQGRLDSVTLEAFKEAAAKCTTRQQYNDLLAMHDKIEARIKEAGA